MKAWVIDKPESITLQEIKENEIPANNVKIKITLASLSLTDAKAFKGDLIGGVQYPFIPGRHAVGIISEIDENNSFGLSRGQRVVIDPNIPCNNCYACKTHRPWECEKMKVMGFSSEGLIRDFACVPVSNVYQIPQQISDKEAQYVEYTSIAVKVFNELKVAEGEHIVIIGASILGIIMAQLALYYQAVPIILDPHQDKLDIATNLGIYYTINTSTADPNERIKQITGGRYCECSIYLANSNDKIQKAFDYASVGGRVAIVGWEYIAEIMNGNVSGILSKQLTVMGINNGQKQIPAAINMLAKKVVDVSPFKIKDIKFDEVDQGLKEYSQNLLRYHKIFIKI
ncbi:MAG TPA: alcohol dehydrogenase catalytic domain-containing protein [Clostridia bacterium]